MVLTVEVSDWELEESGRIVRVGDDVRLWLIFEEAARSVPGTQRASRLRGRAVPLESWPGAEFGRHPTRIDVEGGAVYWDAPEPVSGPIEAVGTIRSNTVDAPDGFPGTSAVVRRLRMVWDDVVVGTDGDPVVAATRYEEVASTYVPRRRAPARSAGEAAIDRRWAGVLMDLETAGAREG